MRSGAIVFDLDDTLVREEPVAVASLRSSLALLPNLDVDSALGIAQSTIRQVWSAGPFFSICLELGISSWEGLWSTFEGNHPMLDGLRDWSLGYRVQAWSEVLDTFGFREPTRISQISEHYVSAQRSGHSAIKGALEVVVQASVRHSLGLLTNGPSDIQHLKFDQSGLSSYFDGVTISGEFGTGKPAAAAFENILGQLDADPRNSTMVGDNWDRDIVGATNLGMAAIWISWGRAAPVQLVDVTVVDNITALTSFSD